jgi:predicted nucleic acid-binding protein
MDVNLIKTKIEQIAIIYEEIVTSISPDSIPDDKSREAIIGTGLLILGKTLTSLEMALYAPESVIDEARQTVAHMQLDG